MPTTKDQRARHESCNARKKNGERCRNYAGAGTNHLGVGACRYHLGNTETHKKAAVKVMAERGRAFAQEQAIRFGQELRMDPLEALLWSLHLSASHTEFLRQEIAGVPNGKAHEFRREVLLRQWSDERERLARTAKMALDAGVAERQIKMAERYAELLARLIQSILGDLNLTQRQREVAPEVVRRHLLALDAPAE
jgi:hypothetical protein